MAMSMVAAPKRRQVLWAAALLTLILCASTAWRDQDEVVGSDERGEPRRQAVPSTVPAVGKLLASSEPEGLLERDPLVESTTDLFRFVSFQPPAPKALPPPPAAPVPKPSAPAFPYQYFGRMVDVNGKTVTYLTRSDTLIPIQAGQLLDNTYRIDAVTETQIVVTYVPMEEKIVIAVQTAH